MKPGNGLGARDSAHFDKSESSPLRLPGLRAVGMVAVPTAAAKVVDQTRPAMVSAEANRLLTWRAAKDSTRIPAGGIRTTDTKKTATEIRGGSKLVFGRT